MRLRRVAVPARLQDPDVEKNVREPCLADNFTGQIRWSEDPGRTMQLQYVDMKFARALYPFRTPQSILLSREGKVLWVREGSMDDQSLRTALRALGRIR